MCESFADGAAFGNVDPYEQLSGQVHFEIAPEAPGYQNIVDLAYAPRNESGWVEFSTNLVILKPVDLARGNRRLLYDVNHRGNKRVLRDFNTVGRATLAARRGRGSLRRSGYADK